MIPRHFEKIDEVIFKMYKVLGFEIVFHKIFEESWKQI
jgi:hypothetical protein